MLRISSVYSLISYSPETLNNELLNIPGLASTPAVSDPARHQLCQKCTIIAGYDFARRPDDLSFERNGRMFPEVVYPALDCELKFLSGSNNCILEPLSTSRHACFNGCLPFEQISKFPKMEFVGIGSISHIRSDILGKIRFQE